MALFCIIAKICWLGTPCLEEFALLIHLEYVRVISVDILNIAVHVCGFLYSNKLFIF